ncbi:MAG: type II and III secretion system protein family protein [Myxococcales bacterium]
MTTAAQAPEAHFITESHKNVGMEVGETRLMSLSTPIIRVSVADPNVADVQVVTPEQVLITAKSVGFTHLILWGAKEVPLVVAVSATRNLDQLRAQFKGLFPDTDIQVSAVGDLIVLSGSVTDLRLPARAAEVAKLHSEKVANLIQVTGDQQVQLDVRFAEVSKTGLRKIGVNMLWQDSARGLVGGAVPPGAAPGSYLTHSPDAYVPGTGGTGGAPFLGQAGHQQAFNLLFSTANSQFPFSAMLSILSQEGLAKVLAEPTLTALSGQDAEFHAGGEVPILIARQLGNVSVNFKKFGVLLRFSPTVLGERTVSLRMGLEVSEPDPSSGSTLGGFVVPGFRTRSSETTVRLRDGQSFAVAGLLSDQTRSLVSKVPWLGDLPIIGTLFRSTQYQRQETELMMVITAHLVKPLQPGEVPILPGEDEYNDPTDFQLFIMGESPTHKRKSYKNGRPPSEDPSASWPYPTEGKRDANQAPERDQAEHTTPVHDPRSDLAIAPHEGPIGPIGFIRN